MLFRHVTGKVVEVNKDTPQYQMYMNSPSWSIYQPIEEKVNSMYGNMTKKELLMVADKKGLDASSKLTKSDIVAIIEQSDQDSVKLNVEFTDNLIK